MADIRDDSLERTLEETPTWAVAVVCFLLVVVSLFIEHLIHRVGHVSIQFISLKNMCVCMYLVNYICFFPSYSGYKGNTK